MQRTQLIIDHVRDAYTTLSASIPPSLDKSTQEAIRAELKRLARLDTPRPVRDYLAFVRPNLGPRDPCHSNPQRTNPRATGTAKALGAVGRGLQVLNIGFGAYQIMTADDGERGEVAAGVAGAVAGGMAGGLGGAELGGWIGGSIGTLFGGAGAAPGAVIGATVGGFLGSFFGGAAGATAAQAVHNGVAGR